MEKSTGNAKKSPGNAGKRSGNVGKSPGNTTKSLGNAEKSAGNAAKRRGNAIPRTEMEESEREMTNTRRGKVFFRFQFPALRPGNGRTGDPARWAARVENSAGGRTGWPDRSRPRETGGNHPSRLPFKTTENLSGARKDSSSEGFNVTDFRKYVLELTTVTRASPAGPMRRISLEKNRNRRKIRGGSVKKTGSISPKPPLPLPKTRTFP